MKEYYIYKLLMIYKYKILSDYVCNIWIYLLSGMCMDVNILYLIF